MLVLVKAPLHYRPCTDRPRRPTAPPHARRSVVREGTARRARVPSVDSADDPLPPSRAPPFLCNLYSCQRRRSPRPSRRAQSAASRRHHDHWNRLSPSTGWPITITGIRTFEFSEARTHGIYDNMKTAVESALVGKERQFNRRFLQMCEHDFWSSQPPARPPQGGRRGRSEDQVGNLRERLFTPRLRVTSGACPRAARSADPGDELNTWLLDRCVDYDKDVYNGDVGVASGIDMEEGEFSFDFKGRDVNYGFGELDELCWPMRRPSTRARARNTRLWSSRRRRSTIRYFTGTWSTRG